MSIVRIGLSETDRFAEGYAAIFGKKKSANLKKGSGAAKRTQAKKKSKAKKK